jgi:biotin synthase
MQPTRTNWTQAEIADLYDTPLLELVYQAATVHRQHNNPQEVQVCTLLSVKTGGCPEDCAYCPQAARYNTGLEAHKLMSVEEVLEAAKQAKANGSTRFCMGAAWREVRNNRDFDRVKEMIAAVNGLGLEVCATMGMATEDQLREMKDAGLYAYNHNLDTSEEHYGEIITTRTYQHRLDTLANIRNAGVTVCCGGIVGMGETKHDRVNFLHTLCTMDPHPESVPINALVAVDGTPLQGERQVDTLDLVRMIALARILMPTSMVRLSAGRVNLTKEEQALCFMAGANSIFAGEKLLTTLNNAVDADQEMFRSLGLSPRPAFKGTASENQAAPFAEPTLVAH